MRVCFSAGRCIESAHVVQPIGQLDEDDADVLGHGQEHLADVLGLLLFMAVGADLGQLGHAVDELRHFRPEALLDVVEREVRVLGDVVQEGGGDGGVVQAQLGTDEGRADGVVDEASPLLRLCPPCLTQANSKARVMSSSSRSGL